MSYSVRWTGRLLDPLTQDIRNLAGLGDPQYWPLTWLPDHNGKGVFFPPGLWYQMTPGPDRPWLWHLPPPHHPLEAVAALRGWGGIKDRNEPPDWVRVRGGSWLDHTVRLGLYLFTTPAETRLLWHILTPMRTNGGQPVGWHDGALKARARLYKAGGLSNPEYHAGKAVVDVQAYREDRPPTRMNFWGDEVTGEVEL